MLLIEVALDTAPATSPGSAGNVCARAHRHVRRRLPLLHRLAPPSGRSGKARRQAASPELGLLTIGRFVCFLKVQMSAELLLRCANKNNWQFIPHGRAPINLTS